MSTPENNTTGQQPSSSRLPIIHVNQPPNLKTANDSEEWAMFKILYENYAIVNRLDEQPPELQRAIFLSIAGPVGVKIYSSIKFESEAQKNEVKTILDKFDERITGKYNETYERYVFNQRNQKQGESIEEYVCALTEMAKRCTFCNCLEDSLIRDRLVMGIQDYETRKTLLQKPNLTLEECIITCKTTEATTNLFKSMARTEHEENKVYKMKQRRHEERKENHHSRNHINRTMKCLFCSKEHKMIKELCPAWGKKCDKCGMNNHFKGAPKCPKSNRRVVYCVEEDSESEVTSDSDMSDKGEDDEFSFKLCSNREKNEIHAVMEINQIKIRFQIDSGATVNIIPSKYIDSDIIMETKATLNMYNEEKLKPVGECMITLTNPRNAQKHRCKFLVVNENLTPLLGKKTSEKMGLITINYEEFIHQTTANPRTSYTETQDIMISHPEVFQKSLGNLPGEVTLSLKEGAVPVIMPARRIPISQMKLLQNEINEMCDNKVIKPVEEPTDWVNQCVVQPKKNGKLRVCIDPLYLNKALKKVQYHLPTLDEVLPELANARIFTKLDLSSGYWHVKLDEQSSYMTTFQVPGGGRYRWLRLPFGLAVSSEIFQAKLHQAIGHINGVFCVADDIIVYGNGQNDTEAAADHDNNLRKLLDRCQEMGVKLNKDKSEVRKLEIA